MSTEGGFGGTSSSDAQQSLQSFWPRVMEEIRNLTVVRKNEKFLSSIKSHEMNNQKTKTCLISSTFTKA